MNYVEYNDMDHRMYIEEVFDFHLIKVWIQLLNEIDHLVDQMNLE
jgi:hypothetical protein